MKSKAISYPSIINNFFRLLVILIVALMETSSFFLPFSACWFDVFQVLTLRRADVCSFLLHPLLARRVPVLCSLAPLLSFMFDLAIPTFFAALPLNTTRAITWLLTPLHGPKMAYKSPSRLPCPLTSPFYIFIFIGIYIMTCGSSSTAQTPSQPGTEIAMLVAGYL